MGFSDYTFIAVILFAPHNNPTLEGREGCCFYQLRRLISPGSEDTGPPSLPDALLKSWDRLMKFPMEPEASSGPQESCEVIAVMKMLSAAEWSVA